MNTITTSSELRSHLRSYLCLAQTHPVEIRSQTGALPRAVLVSAQFFLDAIYALNVLSAQANSAPTPALPRAQDNTSPAIPAPEPTSARSRPAP